jgi:AcrR family transcriptional regulator
MAPAPRLSVDDWALAALEVIALRGLDGLSVEGLARQLGVTKGSFYWHFADRSELIGTTLLLWEQRGTLDVIAQLETLDDPADQLRSLFDTSFGDEVHGLVDVAMVTRADDPTVGPVVRRVSETRIAFLHQLFRALGFTPAKAAIRARVAYSAYIGHFLVRRSLPDDPVLVSSTIDYRRQLLELLSADRPAAGRDLRPVAASRRQGS